MNFTILHIVICIMDQIQNSFHVIHISINIYIMTFLKQSFKAAVQSLAPRSLQLPDDYLPRVYARACDPVCFTVISESLCPRAYLCSSYHTRTEYLCTSSHSQKPALVTHRKITVWTKLKTLFLIITMKNVCVLKVGKCYERVYHVVALIA